MLRNVQPMFADLEAGGVAMAHNGNLTNFLTLRERLVSEGHIFQSTSDSEVIMHLIAMSRRARFIDRFIEALSQIEGGYALVALTNKKLIGARDPLGIRPLVLGELNGKPVLASETRALDMVGATFVRDVEHGEIVVISSDGVESIKPFPAAKARPCVFEYVYFAMPDLVVNGLLGLRRAEAHGPAAGRGEQRAGRRHRAGARFRRAGCARLRPGQRHPLRDGHHPQPPPRAHLHPAQPGRPRAVGEDEAQPQPRGAGGQARGAGGRLRSCAAPPWPRW